MFKNIIKHFPEPLTYNTYIEPFSGSYSIGLKMPYIPPNEIYNDLEQNVYSLFKVLQDEELFAKFKRLADLTPYSEQLRYEYIHKLKEDDIDIVDRAFMYFYVNKTSRNGIGGISVNLCPRRNMSKSVSDYLSTVDNLLEFHQRISHLVIMNRDGISLIEKYGNDERIFMYCDPPYVQNTRTETRYKIDMPDEIQEKFIDACIKAKCKLLISGYDNELYKRLEEAGFKKIEFEVNVWGGDCTNKTKTECLWKNYDNNTNDINDADDNTLF